MKTDKKKLLKDNPTLNKFYNYLDNQYKNKSSRDIANNIISTIFIGLLLVYFTTQNIVFGVANIIFCVANIILSSVQLYKKRNKELHITILISQIIFIVLSLAIMLI